MTILVTGGTGLIGSRLLRRLVASGIECRALVRAGNKPPSGATATLGDVLEPTSLGKAVDGVSAIVHLAALLRTPLSTQIWAVNLQGTRNLIEAAKQYAPRARFIMASTSMVYNINSPHPAREEDAVDPERAYPASKVAAERELRNSGLIWSILRFGFVYGDKDGHLQSVPKLAERFKWHPALRLSMIHHRDIAVVVQLALTGSLDGRVVNAADEAPMSVFEICELVGAPLEPSCTPIANPWWGQIDGAVARRLGFCPTVATVHQAVREDVL